MGKNQAYKAMQKARSGSSSAGPDEVEDGMIDGTFHSPEWHAARLASLKTSHTVTWEEFKKKKKEDDLRKGELEADKDKMMREYRAQLDAERESKLANGRNRSTHKKDRKSKDSKKKSDRKRKRSRRKSSEASSTSSSESSCSDDEKESRSERSRSKKAKKERRHKSRSSRHSSDSEDSEGPLPLSRFFGNAKN